MLYLGCAGWSLPRELQKRFPGTGSHLERYARKLPAVEIDSSFYRPHRTSTYARWADSVPENFRFAVKIPREITHRCKLQDTKPILEEFLNQVAGLGSKLGVLLVQLPPSLVFDAALVPRFFRLVRRCFSGGLACEPRHPNWFTSEVDRQLARQEVARVAADPAVKPAAARPGGWKGLIYYRLHGSPRKYYSAYAPPFLQALAENLSRYLDRGLPCWCIFDNTAAGAAIPNALEVADMLSH